MKTSKQMTVCLLVKTGTKGRVQDAIHSQREVRVIYNRKEWENLKNNLHLKNNILSIEVKWVKEFVDGKYRTLPKSPEYIENEVSMFLNPKSEKKDQKDLKIEKLEKAVEALLGKKLGDEKIEGKTEMIDEIESLTGSRPHPNTGYEKLSIMLEEAREKNN